MLVMINQSCFVLLIIATTLSIAPLTPIDMKEFNKGLSVVALLVRLSRILGNFKLTEEFRLEPPLLPWAMRTSSLFLCERIQTQVYDVGLAV
jgi:hypothetical protein